MFKRIDWIISVRQQLIIVNLLLCGVLFLVGRLASEGLARVQVETWRLVELGAATRAFQDADMAHDAVRADVLDLLDGSGHPGTDLVRHSDELRSSVAAARERWQQAGETEPFPEVDGLVNLYLSDAYHVAELGRTDPAAAAAAYPAFADRFVGLERRMAGVTNQTLEPAARAAVDAAAEAERRVESWIALGATLAALVLSALLWGVGDTLVRRLERLAAVAEQMRAGRLESRTRDVRDDEVGALGASFNAMADSLAALVHRHESDADRTAFSSRLARALDLADNPSEVAAAVERALGTLVPSHPAEMLLSDSSQANLERAAGNPVAGHAGCAVESPWACIAVRRATTVVANDSEALDACPRLRGRAGGACSAACVPVSFMGRALGVVHMTAPAGSPPAPEIVEQLGVLASQAGARMGTIRVMAKSQLQASTDPLTGLFNRRTVEEKARQISRTRQRYVVVMADLDHFKRLNDTYGAETGDRALRRFAHVLRDGSRGSDVIGRYGGDEFILLLPGANAEGALVAVERARETLRAQPVAGDGPALPCSFGVAAAEAGEPFEASLRRANAALQRAKEQGRDRVAVAGADEVLPEPESALGLTG